MTTQTSAQLPTRLHEFAEMVQDNYDGRLDAKQRIPWYDDEESLQKHGEQRRVVWLSRLGKFHAPKQAGGRPTADGTARITLCAVRDAFVEVHLFAESLAKVEALLDGMIAAICLTMNGVVDLTDYGLVTQQEAQSGRNLRSQYAVLRFVLPLPVPGEISLLGDYDSVEDECGLVLPDDTIELSDGVTTVPL